MQIFGVILAGGQARRMGGADKAFLPLAGQPLIRHVLDRLQPQVLRVIISANGDPARFGGLGCDVVPDSVPQGPLSGVLAAMRRAGALGATHLASAPVDTPFLPRDMVRRLQKAAMTAPEGLALARTPDGDHPVAALWPIGLADALATFLAAGGAKVTGFADAHRAVRADFPDARAFLNLNRPEDLAAAQALPEAGA